MNKTTLNIILILFICEISFSQISNFHIIPKQTNNTFKLLGDENRPKYKKTINTFEISSLITLVEYNEYLSDIKRDSTQKYYQTQLPDTSICLSKRQEYLNNRELQNEPIIGVSWEIAMNFCKWKTIKENDNEIKFIYRLPYCSEWIFALNFLQNSGITNDFSQKYSDWLLNSKDETMYSFNKNFDFDYIYFANKNDPPALKRKVIIGNSYLFKQPKLIDYFQFSYYSNHGYSQAGFRCVKNHLNDSVLNDKYSIESIFINHWKLKTKENYNNVDEFLHIRNDSVAVNYQMKDKLLDRYYTSRYKNGYIKSIGIFNNNQKNGIWSVWDSFGTLKNQRYYYNNFEFETIFPKTSNIKTTKYILNKKYELNYNSNNFINYFIVDERMVYASKIICRNIPKKENSFLSQDILKTLYQQLNENRLVCYSENFKDTIKFINLPLLDTINFAGIQVKELWFYDTHRFISEKRIINFIPQITLKNSTDTINLGTFYFPDLRKVFAQISINTDNKTIKTLDDLFFFQYFCGYVYMIEERENHYIDNEKKNYDIDLIEFENDIIIDFY